MKYKILLIALILIALMSSCNKKYNFDVAISSSPKKAESTKMDKINKKYEAKYGKSIKFNLKYDRNFLYTTNYKLLLDSTFDMAVISNIKFPMKDSNEKENTLIKAVLPINSRFLYIAYNHDKINPISLDDLFENKNVVILSNETDFIKNILSEFGIDISKINFLLNRMNLGDNDTNKMDSLTRDSVSKVDYGKAYKEKKPIPYDIEIGFSSQNFTSNGRLHKLLNTRKEFVLYSIDDYLLYKNGSKAEGFCLRNKYFSPFLLPKGAYGNFPREPILTIREDFILAAREDFDDEIIYNLVKTAIEETDLIDISTYGANFENISFAYPIHEGTKRYLDKNAPTFFEKYSELLGKIGAGIGGLYTALMGFLLWRKKRRRRTIVHDFQIVLDMQAKLKNTNSTDELEEMFLQLQIIEQDYHLMVIEHKILVDETLQIFFDMIDKIEGYILEELRKRNG